MPDRRTPDWAAVAALALTGAAIVLEPISGVTSLLSRVAALGAFGAADAQLHQVSTKVAGLEERVAVLEQMRVPYRRISGAPLKLLALCVLRESATLFDHVDPTEAQADLGLSVHECREAIEDLRDFGLIRPTEVISQLGFCSLYLTGSAYVATAPSVIPDVDVSAELSAVIAEFRGLPPERPRVRVEEMLAHTSIPAPRLELLLKALVEHGLIEVRGPGSRERGSYLFASLTPEGRRFIRDAGGGAA